MSSAEQPGSGPGDTIQELARAKVNLTLRVVGRRADGYHEIQSLVVFADVGDVLTLRLGADAAVAAEGPFASGIVGENLVARTLERLAETEPALRLGSVTLQKNIPIAAGLGGGSADAAAVLRAVRRANPEFATRVDWHGVAAGLGADVPVCLDQIPAQMWGIGDRLRPVPRLPRLDAVLVRPAVSAPPDKTAQVFRRLAAAQIGAGTDGPESLPAPMSVEDLRAYVTAQGNDLEAAASLLMPGAAEAERVLIGSGCRLARMSGAGPSWFGLFETRDHADAAAGKISHAYPDWWVRSVTLG
jgi:4-diphosphocytidyl-2-C-methyl-D-erythritol kinase